MKNFTFIEGWAIRKPVLIFLMVAVFFELAEFAMGFPAMITVGWVSIPWTVLPCVVALIVVISVSQGFRLELIDRQRAIGFAALCAIGFMFAGEYVATNGADVAVAIFVAVSVEEAVYRFAIPVAVMFVLVWLKMDKRHALLSGLILSVALFAMMPGHQAQLVDVRSWVALVSFSLLMSHAVWRGNSLFAAIIAHAVYNYANLGMQAGEISGLLRLAGAATALIALVVIVGKPSVRVVDIRSSRVRSDLFDSGEMIKNPS